MIARRLLPGLVAALALIHGLLYAWLIPPWQAPDEPSQFEYAALIAKLGRVPAGVDADAALDARMLASFARTHFFEYLTGKAPPSPPKSMDEARALFFMPRQVGHDPPLYFWLAALPIRALAGWPIERQLLVVRVFGALLTAGAALCAYGAARELFGASASMAVGLAAALQPMFAFVGMGAGDDTLANLLGAALCWATVRSARRGLNWRRAVALLGLALLGLFSKRTVLPWVLLLALAGAWLAIRALIRAPLGRWARAAVGAVALLALAGGAAGARAAGRDPAIARDWDNSAAIVGAARLSQAPRSGSPVLEIRAGQNAVQGVPPVAMEWAQNHELRMRARVWAASGNARGRLSIDFGWARVEQPFSAGETPRLVDMRAFVPLFCPYLVVGIFADEGTIYADRIGAASDRQPGVAMLDNGDLAEPGLRDGAPERPVWQFLRLRELGWAWRSGWLLGPPPLGWALGRIFFASFWGQFGWMSLPIVAGTPWERGLWLICGGGLLGALRLLASRNMPAWRRRALGLLLAGPALGLLLPLLNAYTQPRDQAIQQGRYLFPMLAPVLLLIVAGWRAFVPPRWRAAALALWAGWWLAFAVTALALLLSVYDPRFGYLHKIFL